MTRTTPPADQKLTVRLSTELYAHLIAIAVVERRSVSAAGRDAIAEYVRAKKEAANQPG